jgi:dienelactone hydrolase
MRSLAIRSVLAGVSLAAVMMAARPALAQQEIPPPQGKGHVVVVVSGLAGAKHDEPFAHSIAKLGYDVVLFDGKPMEGTHGEALKTAVQQAMQMPNALPGKVALVCLSLGGAICLGFGSMWPDTVAVDIVWYPATSVFHDIPGFIARVKVPVLMFAGEADTFRNCCLIATAREFSAASSKASQPFEVVTYPGTNHDFIEGGANYNPTSYKDAMEKTAAKLKATFPE